MIEVILIAQLSTPPVPVDRIDPTQTLGPLNPARVVDPPDVDVNQRYKIDTETRILPDQRVRTNGGNGGNTRNDVDVQLKW